MISLDDQNLTGEMSQEHNESTQPEPRKTIEKVEKGQEIQKNQDLEVEKDQLREIEKMEVQNKALQVNIKLSQSFL